MIKPTRLYKVSADVSLSWIYAKLAMKKTEFIVIQIPGEESKTQLGSIIQNLEWSPDRKIFSGVLSYETIVPIENLDGTYDHVKTTRHSPFLFTEGSTIMVAFCPKDRAERCATYLTKWFGGEAYVSNVSFSSLNIEQFLTENPHILKRCYWGNLRIPGVNQANLGGTNVSLSDDAGRYDDLGDKKYIWVELFEEELTVSISSRGGVGFLTKIDRAGMLDFLQRKIFPMITF